MLNKKLCLFSKIFRETVGVQWSSLYQCLFDGSNIRRQLCALVHRVTSVQTPDGNVRGLPYRNVVWKFQQNWDARRGENTTDLLLRRFIQKISPDDFSQSQTNCHIQKIFNNATPSYKPLTDRRSSVSGIWQNNYRKVKIWF